MKNQKERKSRKGLLQPLEWAEKSRKNGEKGGRPKRKVIFQNRVLEDGEKIELPEPNIIFEELLHFIKVKGTAEEIAAYYLMSVDTLDRKLKEFLGMGFAELKKVCQPSGDLGLKVLQFSQAKKNIGMSKHLGECWLGQKSTDKLEITHLESKIKIYIPDNERNNLEENKIDESN